MGETMGIRIRYFNKTKFFWGCLLVILGICMPYFLTINTLKIPEQTLAAIISQDKMELWMAAVKLAALNSVRAFPHAIGAYIISESIEVDSSYKITKWLKSAIVCVIIPPVYSLISYIHHIKYDFGVPAFALIILLIVLGKRDYNYVSLWKKVALVIVFMTALQFLDIMPGLSNFYTGRGEMSKDVKLVAKFLDMESALDITSMIFFFGLMFMALLLFFLIRDENNLLAMNDLKEQNERMLMETKMHVLENRTYLEMRHLVHDLKSPLTSAQALVGVVRMSCKGKSWEKESDYLSRVETSIDKMSRMISEILYEDQQNCISTEEILDSVLAQISVSEYSQFVHVDNQAVHQHLMVNKIRFSRALVNLLENSFYALPPEDGKIDFVIDIKKTDNDEKLRFSIKDNGKGIDEKTLDFIWESGFSTRSSHGLGLSFVKKVVADSGGTIQIYSEINAGTEIEIMLPVELKGEEIDESRSE
ncbi:MAG: HAMP domain-containing sensor histidine kinase [Clostridium sp.]